MKKSIKALIPSLLAAFVLIVFSTEFASATTLAAPTLLKVNSSKSYSISAPVISGVTQKNTNVLVYVDDVFAGNAVVQDSETVTESFYFQVFGLSEGTHSVYLIAEDDLSLVRSEKSPTFNLKINPISAPTLVVPNQETVTGKEKPLIEGFTNSGTFVHIYIDGAYNGKTELVEHESGTAYFSYVPFLNLNIGKHKMWAVSEDGYGRKSAVSKVMEFGIENKMPAPTLLKTETNANGEIIIRGLSKNNSKIKIFVNKKFAIEFFVRNHDSGVANFYYKVDPKLRNSNYLVYATATDKRGKESAWSNILYSKAVNAVNEVQNNQAVAEISQEGALETVVKDNNDNSNQDKTEDGISNNTKIKDYLTFAELYKEDKDFRLKDDQYKELETIVSNKESYDLSDAEGQSLENLLLTETDKKTDDSKINVNASSTETTGGAIDEKKEKQSTIGWNAFIFILFLIAVIAWIFWVNKELIKEKKEQEEKEKEAKTQK